MNFKDFHIGNMLLSTVKERKIESQRICKFIPCTEDELLDMYKLESLDCKILLRWSKLLDYDFFRLYSQHLILYSPTAYDKKKKVSGIPAFKKNIYTIEIIHFILEQIQTNKKTINQVIKDYNIPKTTLYKWIKKYNSNDGKEK